MADMNTSTVGPVNPTAQPGFAEKLFTDPGFLSMLAGTGAKLDPNGFGGALGGATQQWIQSEQAGKAAAKQSGMIKDVIEALKGTGGSVKVGQNGEVNVSVKSNVTGATGQPAASSSALGSIGGLEAPTSPASNTSAVPAQQRNQNLMREAKQNVLNMFRELNIDFDLDATR